MEGWIKLHRQFMKWEWFEDSNMVKLFIYLMLTANIEDKKWRGIDVKRGQVVIGRKSLSKAVNLSEQSVRTCLNRLKSTNEITIKSTNKYSVLTVCNYETYQGVKSSTNQQTTSKPTNNQPTTNQQSTTTKELKKEKNDKNLIKRQKEFRDEVMLNVMKYPEDMLEQFVAYWGEFNRSKTKMRFEMQQTWQLSGRLATWFKRSKFSKSDVSGKNNDSDF